MLSKFLPTPPLMLKDALHTMTDSSPIGDNVSAVLRFIEVFRT
jgi:hypothetical protein